MVPRKPRAASSKSAVSANGSVLRTACCCAMTEGDASFGRSATSLMAASLMMILPERQAKHLRWMRGEIGRIGDRPGRRRLHAEDLAQMHLVRTIADPQQPSPGQRLVDR